jgi:hypothetical protein
MNSKQKTLWGTPGRPALGIEIALHFLIRAFLKLSRDIFTFSPFFLVSTF